MSVEYIREVLRQVATPRSWTSEREANRAVAHWIELEFRGFGLAAEIRGRFANVLGYPPSPAPPPRVLICAHYDSVPGSPGADDNASGLAAMLASARLLARDVETVAWIAFNAEEVGLKGSREFVAEALPKLGWQPEVVHVLEMVGFSATGSNSQRKPEGLPVALPSVGDFIGIIANGASAKLAQEVRRVWSAYVPGFPTQTLTIHLGLERLFHDLLRSDHVPFWEERVPALMWTDTAEFRNPHYHEPTDVPETLDVPVIQAVARALVAHVLCFRRGPQRRSRTSHGGRRR